jgi:hypothetical protein
MNYFVQVNRYEKDDDNKYLNVVINLIEVFFPIMIITIPIYIKYSDNNEFRFH